MKRVLSFLIILLAVSLASAKDPFSNKEDAVGYIVIDRGGSSEKFIVVESKGGKVKLIKTGYEPDKVLKQGGKRR